MVRDIPGYLWDPATNRYYKDDGRTQRAAIAQKKSASLLDKINPIKLVLEIPDSSVPTFSNVILEASQLRHHSNHTQVLIERKLGYLRPPQIKPVENYAELIKAVSIPYSRCTLREEGDFPPIQDPEEPIYYMDGAYATTNGINCGLDDEWLYCRIRSAISTISFRDDRLFVAFSKDDDFIGQLVKVSHGVDPIECTFGFNEPITLSAVVPNQFATFKHSSPYVLLATDTRLIQICSCMDGRLQDPFEEDAFDLNLVTFVTEPSKYTAIAWAEYETPGKRPTAFVSATGGRIAKIVYTEKQRVIISESLPSISSILSLQSHKSTHKLFAITSHSRLLTIDWTQETPIFSAEINLAPFQDPAFGAWQMQILDEDKVWLGQKNAHKVFLWSWTSPLAPVAIVDLAKERLNSLQFVNNCCMIVLYFGEDGFSVPLCPQYHRPQYIQATLGYLRFALAIAAYYFIADPSRFLPLYITSCLLDAVDGHAARFLNQCSRFGAVLDMVADRSTTAGLTCYLAHIYPQFMLLWQVLIGLDLTSHYMHMYASLITGSTSHKLIDKRQNFLLRAYYSYQSVLFLVCAGNELFYLAAYMLASTKGPLLGELLGRQLHAWEMLLVVSTPVWAFKQFMNVVQMVGAAKKLAAVDQKVHSN